jgi:hypothetical protein
MNIGAFGYSHKYKRTLDGSKEGAIIVVMGSTALVANRAKEASLTLVLDENGQQESG